MKNTENMELLTPELYQQISGDKTTRIVALKNLRSSLIEQIESEEQELKTLEEKKAQLEAQIYNVQVNLRAAKGKKFKTVRELGKQKRLANKINKLATKEESYIEVEKFYPEDKPKKR